MGVAADSRNAREDILENSSCTTAASYLDVRNSFLLTVDAIFVTKYITSNVQCTVYNAIVAFNYCNYYLIVLFNFFFSETDVTMG